MARDNIYKSTDVQAGTFEFNEAVAAVFPDMLQRSIPGYQQTIEAIGMLARRHVQPASHCYDLGCSLGAATIAMRHGIEAQGCKIIAVDNASAMVERCRSIVAADDAETPVEVLLSDLQEVSIDNASMVVMNYTLQFLPQEERAAVIRRIANGMRPGGVFVLSEKVIDEDAALDEHLTGLHHDFKRQNAYSELEIARKRAAIDKVLVPETVASHVARLKDAGFRHAGVWLRWFNFVSLLAIR
ncbi:MAG: carboxy-S-adenosyl-L-methionine synthase CmoA [Woeseia sp.]|nr:carboxy-S-adenosyl-L-methionine synthase CmoA [Woeseia sp.]MBT8098039.1 carboxy-S-adenosyl-L-methionine synthase CmoA [Woeseia sp.]NNE59934.1 carboxy-S-adenosyl-L-methionine synthase CmoA [Woeseia sp.]NNL55121.1 carboxy-S-adenosyl-L-methionine synthase CmoA [Woeseia sp.]